MRGRGRQGGFLEKGQAGGFQTPKTESALVTFGPKLGLEVLGGLSSRGQGTRHLFLPTKA